MSRFIPWMAILLFAVGVAIWHNFIPAGHMQLHHVYPLLYQFPVVLAGLLYGKKGAAATGLFVSVLSVPHLLFVIRTDPSQLNFSVVEILIYFVVGLAIGSVSDRMRREQREKSELLNDFRIHEKKSALWEIAYVITHELKTPIASLSGAVELLRDEKTPPEHRAEYLDILGKELGRMNGLVNRTLALFRDRRMELTDVPVEPFFREIASIASLMRNRKPEISFRYDIRSETIRISPDLIKEALLNLIDNAMEAADGTAKILITVSDRGGILSISVRDNGAGMDASVKEKIFTPFYTTKPSGNGLGLSVVRRIAELHGGRVNCESALGEGSCFIIAIPGAAVEPPRKSTEA